MSFPDSVKAAVLRRANGRCECDRSSCSHRFNWAEFPQIGRCTAALVRWDGVAMYEFNHKHAFALGGADTERNCEVLCSDCHRQTASYGRHAS